MTTTLETQTRAVQYAGRFDEAAFNRVSAATGQPGLLRARREAAFQVYQTTPAPTVRDEEWRRTDPSLFPFAQFEPLPLAVSKPVGEAHPWDDQFDVVVEVDDAGYSIRDLGGLGLGVEVVPLPQAESTHESLLQQYFQARALPPQLGKFAALNGAFWNVGFLVRIPRGLEVPKGILIRYSLTSTQAAVVPRMLAVAEAGSRAHIVEHFQSPDSSRLLCVTGKEFFVEEGANLKVLSLQEWGSESYLIDNGMARAERDATIEWITLNFGTRLSKLKFGSDVAGAGSKAELDGIYFANERQHLDQKTLQIHSSPHTYSRLLYKGAVRDQGHSVYQGIIQARKGAIDVDAYQTNNNLVLSDGARADTIPGLLIDADDLKCSHGATIGNVDEEQVFYLRARGLDEQVARKIVILGYFDEIVERIPYAFIRDRVHQVIERKLGF